MTRDDLIYLAATVDCEGCVSVAARNAGRGNYITPTLQITNTDRALIDWLLANVGGTVYIRPEPRDNRKPCWLWRCAGDEARQIIRSVRPWLKLKQHQADLVLGIESGLRGERLYERNRDVISEMRELNRRGVA